MSVRFIGIRITVLILIAGAIIISFLFALGNLSFKETYPITVDFNFSGGIQTGAPVKISGIKVGKVQDVEFIGGTLRDSKGEYIQIRLHVDIENHAREAIRENAEFFINTANILGEKYLEIATGTWDYPPMKPQATIRGIDPPRNDLIIARLHQILDSVSELLVHEKDTIETILHNSSTMLESVSVILEEHQDSIGDLIQSSSSLMGEAAVTLNKIHTGLDDPKQISEFVTQLNLLTKNIAVSIETITPELTRVLHEIARISSTVTTGKANALLDTAIDMGKTTTGLKTLLSESLLLLKDIRAGKGTAGKFLVSDELYLDILEFINNLKRDPWKVLWKE